MEHPALRKVSFIGHGSNVWSLKVQILDRNFRLLSPIYVSN